MFPLHSEMPYIKEDGKRSTLGEMLDQESSDISDLKSRMTTAEDDIDTLEGKMTTAEGDIDTLEGKMTTAEGDIDNLESDVSDLSDAISDAFDNTKTYAVGDYFIYEDTIYEVITACTGITPPNAEYYTAHNVTDLITTLNSSLSEVTPIKWTWGIPSLLSDQGSKVVQIGKYLFVKLIFITDVNIGTTYKNLGGLYVNLGENTRLVNNQFTIFNSDQAINVATFKNGTNYIEGTTSSALVANKWYELATILELDI